jgi:hypothetical protein
MRPLPRRRLAQLIRHLPPPLWACPRAILAHRPCRRRCLVVGLRSGQACCDELRPVKGGRAPLRIGGISSANASKLIRRVAAGYATEKSACWRLEWRIGDAFAWVKASTSSSRDFRVALDRDCTGLHRSHDMRTASLNLPPSSFTQSHSRYARSLTLRLR